MAELPAFPDDIPTAPLVSISLAKLLSHRAHTRTVESSRFFHCCKNLGFFYLQLDTPSGEALGGQAERLFQVGEQLFRLGPHELNQYDFKNQGSYMGYKGLGGSVLSNDGTLDANEFYNISKDDVLGNAQQPWPQPAMIGHHEPLMPPQSADFYTANRLHMGEHSDFGSITILFNRLGGLQVLRPGGEWRYIKPIPGYAIVNLGDALVRFTNGLLRSNLHRVVGPPGAQAKLTRYSVVYFMRPENEVLLRRLEGSTIIPELGEDETQEAITAEEWIKRRGHARRVGIFKQGSEDKGTFKGTGPAAKL